MAEERRGVSSHSVTISRRENVAVTGVLDVISFDEQEIIAETDMGVLVLSGVGLHVNRLNLEKGELEVDGEVTSLLYEEQSSFAKGKGSLLGKLFK